MPLLGIYCSSPVNLPGDAGKEARDLFCEYLQLGADLGVAWIRSINNTTFAGSMQSMSPQEAFERTVEGSRQIAPVARQLNIGLLLENNENTVTPDAESLLQLKRALGDVCHVGIAFDPVNAYFQGLDVEKGIDLLAGHLDILHLKNVRRSRERRWDYVPRGDYSYEWTTLAGGDLDWKALLKRATATGFDGPLVYEYVNPFKGMPLRYWDILPEPEDAARRESLFLRKILEGLAINDR
jgi:sugar phosphate isomerase/epimerase